MTARIAEEKQGIFGIYPVKGVQPAGGIAEGEVGRRRTYGIEGAHPHIVGIDAPLFGRDSGTFRHSPGIDGIEIFVPERGVGVIQIPFRQSCHGLEHI